MEGPKVMQNLGGSTPLQTEGAGSGRHWTPGPWYDDGYRIYGPTGDPDKRSGPLIMEYKHNPEFNLADAALIAAAPELYEALDEFATWEYSDDGGYAIVQMQAKAKAALAKARGEAGEPARKPVRSGVEPQDVK